MNNDNWKRLMNVRDCKERYRSLSKKLGKFYRVDFTGYPSNRFSGEYLFYEEDVSILLISWGVKIGYPLLGFEP